jgi:hypothetical protein
MGKRIVFYGPDVDYLEKVKQARAAPGVFLMVRDSRLFNGELEHDIHEVFLAEPHVEIAKAYAELKIPVSLLDTTPFTQRNPATNVTKTIERKPGEETVKTVTVEEVEKKAEEERVEALKQDPFVEATDQQIIDKLKSHTGRTPSPTMTRERAIELLKSFGVNSL